MRGILFDLDGTLLDTAPDFEVCLNQLRTERGEAPLPMDQIRQVVSQGARGLVRLGFAKDEGDSDYDSLKNKLLDYYSESLGKKTQFFSGIESLITQLAAHDVPWGIVTNKPERFTIPLLETLEFPSEPECVICQDTLEHAKPHPLPLLHGCKLLNIDVKNSLYVGDDQRDVQASHAAGLQSCVVEYGYIHNDQDPKDWQAHYYVKHAQEIWPILEKLL